MLQLGERTLSLGGYQGGDAPSEGSIVTDSLLDNVRCSFQGCNVTAICPLRSFIAGYKSRLAPPSLAPQPGSEAKKDDDETKQTMRGGTFSSLGSL